jgi:hypothetical protein
MCVYISHVLSSKRLFLSRIHEATWKVPQFIKHHKLWPRYFWTLYGWYPKNLDSINVALCMGTEPSINDLNSPWFTFAPPRRWQPTAAKFARELCEASRVINWVLKETVLEITWDMAILLKCGQDKPTRAEIPALNYGHVRDILSFSNIGV